jgi:hypothetical protein
MIACYGVSKISSVLNQQEIKDIRHDMFTFLETNHSKLALRNPPWIETKRQLGVPFTNLYPSQGMLLQHWGIGHAPFLWQLAASETVHYEHFQRIMRLEEPDDDLLVGFLGESSFAFPHRTTKRGFYRGKEKLHLDQRMCVRPILSVCRPELSYRLSAMLSALPRRRDYSDRTGRQQHIF